VVAGCIETRWGFDTEAERSFRNPFFRKRFCASAEMGLSG